MRIDALSWMTGTEAGPADRWEHAGYLFDSGDPAGAATVLAELVAEQPGAAAVRLLLARAYYHSAQLGRAVGAQVYGPAPAPIARVRGRHRVRLLVKAEKAAPLQEALAKWVAQLRLKNDVRIAVDIDPQSFY